MMVNEPNRIAFQDKILNEFSPRCPSCGVVGKPVKTTTLHSLLLPERQDQITNQGYYFCSSEECKTVYFTGNGGHTFTTTDMTVRVGVKEKSSPRPICYCFNFNFEEIDEEIQRTGKSSAIDDIKDHMKKEGCSCEIKNPQGSCCLKTIENYIREALKALEMTPPNGD